MLYVSSVRLIHWILFPESTDPLKAWILNPTFFETLDWHSNIRSKQHRYFGLDKSILPSKFIIICHFGMTIKQQTGNQYNDTRNTKNNVVVKQEIKIQKINLNAIVICVKKQTKLWVGRFMTISGHFLANYINIFHKIELQTIILMCLTCLNLIWIKS